MDKFEYRIRAEEINSLIEQGEYAEAVKIADTIDWRRVKGAVMLCKVAELYMMSRRYEDSKEILLMANDLKPNTRKVIYSLCELSIKLDETVQAVEYYKQYIQIAPRDPDRFILQYRIYESQDVSLEERIAVLEELKKKDYQEKWAYELAYLYHRIGLATKCVEECDQLILFFVEGKYVNMAMELKMLHAPLTPSQQEKYNARFMEEQEAIQLTEDMQPEPEVEEVGPSLNISVKRVEASKARTVKIPSLRLQRGQSYGYDRESDLTEAEDEEAQGRPDPGAGRTRDIRGVRKVIVPEKNTDQLAYEENIRVARIEAGENVKDDEDADMKIAPGRIRTTAGFDQEAGNEDIDQPDENEEDMQQGMELSEPSVGDIKIRTIDAGNRFDTINLEEETSRYLAGEILKLMAEEDMGAEDATKALPMNSVFHDSIDSLSPTVIGKAMEMAQEMNEKRLASLAKVGEGSGDDEEKKTPSFGTGDMVEIVDVYEDEEADKEADTEADEASEDLSEKQEEIAGTDSEEEEGTDAADADQSDAGINGNEGSEETADPVDTDIPDDTDAVTEGDTDTDTAGAQESEEISADDIGEVEELEEIEDIEESEDQEDTQAEEFEEIFDIDDEEDLQQIQALDEEDEALVTAGPDGQEDSGADAEESVQDDQESTPDEKNTETKESAEEESPIQPLVFSQSKPLPKEFIDAIQIVAMEAAKEAAAAAAAAVAKEAATQAASQAAAAAASQVAQSAEATAAALATQAANQAARDAAKLAADQTAAATSQVAAQAARDAARMAADQTADALKDKQEKEEQPEEKQPEPEKQITGQLTFKDLIAEWEDEKKANEEKHIEQFKQRVMEQTGPIFDDFDKTSASGGPQFNMLSPVIDVFNETEDLAGQVEQALYEDEVEDTLLAGGYERKSDEDITDITENESAETQESTFEETDTMEVDSVIAEKDDEADHIKTEETPSYIQDRPSSFNTAEINGLEDKLLTALENQHYDTANIQSEILHSILQEETGEDQTAALSSDIQTSVEDTDLEPEQEGSQAPETEPADKKNYAAVSISGVTSAAEAVALAKAAAGYSAPESTDINDSTQAEDISALESNVTSETVSDDQDTEDVAGAGDAAYDDNTEEAGSVAESTSEESAPAEGTASESTPAENAEAKDASSESEKAQADAEPEAEGRTLSKEEKDIFTSAAAGKQMQMKIAALLDDISMDPLEGNILIYGEKGTEPEFFARELVAAMGLYEPGIAQKMAVLKAEEIKGKDMAAYLSEYEGGSLIVENSGELSADLCNGLIKAAYERSGLLMILTDTPEGMETLKKTSPNVTKYFTKELLIDVLDNNGLVRFAQAYAKDREYSIDDMGRLALYNRIEQKQRSDHAVTVDEVREIVDEAISKAEKKSVGHFMDIVFAKRYDKEDMVVLREKDFLP